MAISNLSYSEFESLCLTCLTTLFGANLAVFTLTISFLLNKKENLKLILKEIQDGGISLTLSNKFSSTKEYISKMKFITSVAATGVISSVVAALVYIVFLFLPHSYWILIILIPIIFSALCCVASMVRLLLWYLKN